MELLAFFPLRSWYRTMKKAQGVGSLHFEKIGCVLLPDCVIQHEAVELHHSRDICVDVLACGLLLSLGLRRVHFAAQAPIFGFEFFFADGCFCFHFSLPPNVCFPSGRPLWFLADVSSA